MGKRIIIEFTDTAYSTDFFGMTMSGASASFMMNGSWNGSYLTTPIPQTPAKTSEILYNYIITNLPVGTDITATASTRFVYLYSESCTSVKFYTNGSTTTILYGDLNHTGLTTTYAKVSSEDWTSNYTVGSNIINLTWSGASDPEQSIKGYDLSYKVGSSTTWISIPLILTSNGAASYNFVISQQVTHEFRVRTVDTSNLVSAYKNFTQIIVPIFQISQVSESTGPACSLSEPNSPIYINTTSPATTPVSINPSIGNYVYTNSTYTTTFDGTRSSISAGAGTAARSWKIKTPSNIYYTCVISASGEITNVVLCTSTYNSGLLSLPATVEINACLNTIVSGNNVYWRYTDSLVVGTILYKDTILLTVVPPGFYQLLYLNPITSLSSQYVIQVGGSGVILSIKDSATFCVAPPGYGTFDFPIVIDGGYYNGSGNGGPKIICNLLYSQGFLSKEIWEADEKFGRLMLRKNKEVSFGYLTWAKPVVSFLTKNPQYSKYLYLIVKPWSEHMAYKMGVLPKDNKIGKIINYIGSKFSILIYKLIISKRKK